MLRGRRRHAFECLRLPCCHRREHADFHKPEVCAGPHYPSLTTTFSDRGIPDTLCYARLIGLRDNGPIETACREYRYAPVVFLAPPGREIYETDRERKQDFAEAERTYAQLAEVYRDCGYELAVLPRLPPPARAEFILTLISQG